jgi:hypothetical protein
MPVVECICGCGTEVPRRLTPTNLIAFLLALELAEWDRFRVLTREITGKPFSADDFITDGANCYQRSLAVLHGELFTSSARETKRWMKFSRKERKKLAKNTGLIDGSKDVERTDDRLSYLDARQPERSYSSDEAMERLRAEGVLPQETPQGPEQSGDTG